MVCKRGSWEGEGEEGGWIACLGQAGGWMMIGIEGEKGRGLVGLF